MNEKFSEAKTHKQTTTFLQTVYSITVYISDFKFPNLLENTTLHFKDYTKFTETIASSCNKFNVQMQLVML